MRTNNLYTLKKYICLLMVVSGILSGTYNALGQTKTMPFIEKVSVITGKDLYHTGEHIQFRANTYDGILGEPLDFSKICYVEVYSQNKKAVVQGKIQLVDAVGMGSLEIPRDIPSGIYYLRAYTNYMKNLGAKSFFIKKLKIVNPFLQAEDSYKGNVVRKGNVICEIYPEGGNVIADHINRIAFEFVNSLGDPVMASARIVNHADSVVWAGNTTGYGFLLAEIFIDGNSEYEIQAVSNHGNVQQKIIKTDSVPGLSVSWNNRKSINVNIIGATSSKIELWINKNGYEYALNEIPEGCNQIKIDKTKLFNGFQALQLRNSYGKVLSERFIYVEDDFDTQRIALNKTHYLPKERIDVLLSNTDTDRMDLFMVSPQSPYVKEAGDLWVENTEFNSELVYLGVSLDRLNKHDINYVDSLNLLFSMQTPSGKKDHGYDYLPELEGDMVSGTVSDVNGDNVNGIEVIQSFVDSVNQVQSYVTDETGKFYFNVNPNKSNSELILKLTHGDRSGNIFLDNEFYNDYITTVWEEFSIDSAELEYLEDVFVNLQIGDVFSTYTKNVHVEQLQGTDVREEQIKTFKLSDYIKLPTVEEYIYEVVSWAVPIRKGGNTTIRIVSEQTKNIIGENPLFLIDGIPFFNSGAVLGLNPDDIESLKVFNEKYFYKNQVYDGILEVKTKKGTAGNIKLPNNTYIYNFISLQESNGTCYTNSDNSTNRTMPTTNDVFCGDLLKESQKDKTESLHFISSGCNGTYYLCGVMFGKSGSWCLVQQDFEVGD